jgi:acyl-CoA reductase-like NAD-dependent aldehyde dehydrogenase
MAGLSSLDGHDLSEGYFYPPTVIEDVSVDDEIWREEIFGPVVVIKRFEVMRVESLVLVNTLTKAQWTGGIGRRATS